MAKKKIETGCIAGIIKNNQEKRATMKKFAMYVLYVVIVVFFIDLSSVVNALTHAESNVVFKKIPISIDWDSDYSFINMDGEEVNLHLAYGRERCEVHRTVGKNISFIFIKEESDNIAEGRLECRKIFDYKSGEVRIVSRVLFYKNEY